MATNPVTATNRVAIYGEWLWAVVHDFISNDDWVYQGCFPALARDKLDSVIQSIAAVYPDFVIVCDGLVHSNIEPLKPRQFSPSTFVDGDSLEIGSGKYRLNRKKLPVEVSALAVNYLMQAYPGKVMRAPYYALPQIAALCRRGLAKGVVGGPQEVINFSADDQSTHTLESCGLFQPQSEAAAQEFKFYTVHQFNYASVPHPVVFSCPVLDQFADVVPLSSIINPSFRVDVGAFRGVLQKEYGTRMLSLSEYLGVAFGSLPIDIAYPFTRLVEDAAMTRISRCDFPEFFPVSAGLNGRSDSFMRPLRSQIHLQMVGESHERNPPPPQMSITFGREALNPPIIQLGHWDLGPQFKSTDDWCKHIGEYVNHAVVTMQGPKRISKVGVQLEARMKSLDLMGYFTHPSESPPAASEERSGTTPYADALGKAEPGTELQIFALIELHRTKVPFGYSGDPDLGIRHGASQEECTAAFLARLMTLMPLRTKKLETWAGPAFACINDWVVEVTRQQINFRDLTCVMTYRANCSASVSGMLTAAELQKSFLFHTFPTPLMGYVVYYLLTKTTQVKSDVADLLMRKFTQIISKDTLIEDLKRAYSFVVNVLEIFKSVRSEDQTEAETNDYEDFIFFAEKLQKALPTLRSALVRAGVAFQEAGYRRR